MIKQAKPRYFEAEVRTDTGIEIIPIAASSLGEAMYIVENTHNIDRRKIIEVR